MAVAMTAAAARQLPLRERKGDIPLLSKHLAELSVKDLKCAKPRLTRAEVVKLQSYDWQGNVRELRNVIERAVILARGGSLDFDLPIQTGVSPSTTPMLLPPDIRDWIPQNHIAHFILEAVEVIPESAGHINWRGSGSEQYPP